jgi:hypothetical protein
LCRAKTRCLERVWDKKLVAENIIPFLFLAGVSTFCRVMAVRTSARRKLDGPTYAFWRLSKEGRESYDAMSLASYLILALVFSIVTLAAICVGVYRFFADQ